MNKRDLKKSARKAWEIKIRIMKNKNISRTDKIEIEQMNFAMMQ